MCAYMYVCIYTAHSHMHIYLKAEYKDISKHLVWIQIFSSSFFLYQPVLMFEICFLLFVFIFLSS